MFNGEPKETAELGTRIRPALTTPLIVSIAGNFGNKQFSWASSRAMDEDGRVVAAVRNRVWNRNMIGNSFFGREEYYCKKKKHYWAAFSRDPALRIRYTDLRAMPTHTVLSPPEPIHRQWRRSGFFWLKKQREERVYKKPNYYLISIKLFG